MNGKAIEKRISTIENRLSVFNDKIIQLKEAFELFYIDLTKRFENGK